MVERHRIQTHDLSTTIDILFGNSQNTPVEPIPDQEIERLLSEHGIKIPPSYRTFLSKSDGLIAYQTEEIFGVKGDNSLIDMKERMKNVPPNLVPFFHGYGGEFDYFDTGTPSEDGEFPVVRWNDHEKQTELTHPNFSEWLNDFVHEFEAGVRE